MVTNLSTASKLALDMLNDLETEYGKQGEHITNRKQIFYTYLREIYCNRNPRWWH